MVEDKSFNRTDLLNTFGGLPDRLMRSIPNFVLEKNRGAREEYLEQLAFYDIEKWSPEKRPFLRLPDTPPPFQIGAGSVDGFETIKYPSRYEPANPALADEYRRHAANLDSYLALWRSRPDSRRPLVLCIHGFLMGQPRRAEAMFKVRSLLARGLDVALYVQPFHWKRAGRDWRQLFINRNDAPLTIETIAQDIHDLHAAVLLLRNMGYEKIGAIGASLGGYAAALYAAAGPAVDFIFTVVPAIDLSAYLQPRAGGFSFKIDDLVRRHTRRALEVVSPLTYFPRYDVNKMALVMHGGDKICDPRFTRQWVERWKIPNVVEVVGGHWLYFDHRVRGKTWYGWLERMGFTT
jgi:pimeloyl-ACP methyl ester carboxylesterase